LPWRKWTKNLGVKVLSFVAALALWFSVTDDIEFEKTITFPIEYVNAPGGITPVTELPVEAEAKIRARGKFLRYRLRGGVCRVDLALSSIGMNNLVLDGPNLVLPGDVSVVHAEILHPRQITVEFDETVTRDIAIHPAVVGEPDPRFVQVGKTFVSPSTARVAGPRKLVDEIGLLSTEPIDIDGHRSTVRKKANLVAPGPATITVRPTMVEVGITIEPKVSKSIPGVALEVAAGSSDGPRPVFEPAAVAIQVSGARSVVDVAASDVSALLLQASAWSPGSTVLRLEELRGAEVVFALEHAGGGPTEVVGRVSLPRGVEIVGIAPERVEVTVAGRERRP
jgi:hypothetical protein